MKRSLWFGLVLVGLLSVGGAQASTPVAEVGIETAQPAPEAVAAQHFGAAFTPNSPMTVAEALGKVDALKDQTIQVKGKVKAVCKKKGCWMQLDPEGAAASPVRVTFKDYGFFVPLDADGSDAIIEGIIEVKVTTEAMRKHFAADGGATPEEIAKIQGDVKDVKFVANGVQLTRPPTP